MAKKVTLVEAFPGKKLEKLQAVVAAVDSECVQLTDMTFPDMDLKAFREQLDRFTKTVDRLMLLMGE